MRRYQRLTSRWLGYLFFCLLGAALSACQDSAVQDVPVTAQASLQEVTSFGSNPGNLRMFRYVPAGLPADAPLVVALHGCTQSARAYADGAGWPKYAERDGFALLFPEQKGANNQNSCFNWFESGDVRRGGGEALSIRQMVDKLKTDLKTDPQRVFVTGLSAGGYMTSVMLATYPDVFAGGGVIAGGPYGCATGLVQAFSCLNPGVDKTPETWGDLVRAASSYTGPWPIVSIWHGDADYTVNSSNLRESMEAWTNVHGTDQNAEVADTVKGVPHRVYKKDGKAVVETYLIPGMGHGTPVDPGSAEDACGQAGAYILDVNVCASYHLGRFWGIVAAAVQGGGDDGGDGGDSEVASCWNATNAEHYAAGRATRNGVVPWENYSAKGSYAWLGYADTRTRLEETRSGYFVKVAAC